MPGRSLYSKTSGMWLTDVSSTATVRSVRVDKVNHARHKGPAITHKGRAGLDIDVLDCVST